MALTALKRKKLHNAIAMYMQEQGFEKSAKAFIDEAKAEPKTPIPKLLETKWTTVLRLQKKVTLLEEQLQGLKTDLENATPYQKRDQDQSQLLPGKCLHELSGHRQPVTCVRFHPKFAFLATASDDCTIQLYDWENGKYERSLKGHTSAVQDLDFTGDGKKLASCSADMSIKIWDFEDDNFKCIKTLQGHDHNVCGVRFLSDDRLVSCSRDHAIKIWDTNTGFCSKTLNGHEDWVKCIAVSGDSSLIASGSSDKSVRVWDITTGSCKQVYNDHNHVVECLAFSNPAADKLIAGEESEEKEDMEEDSEPPPRFLASGSRDRTIAIFDLKDVTCIMTLKGHDNWVRGLCWHPAGKFLLSCADDKTIRVWDLARRKENTGKQKANAHTMFVQTIDWNPIAAVVATGGADNIVKVWECE